MSALQKFSEAWSHPDFPPESVSETELAELEKERSIRRTARLLDAKRSRMIDELNRLISHLSLLVAVPRKTSEDALPETDLLIEAAKRIDDPVFTDLLIQIIQERKNKSS